MQCLVSKIELRLNINKGKTAKPKSQNLLLRLEKYKQETLRFITDFRVPFDNNIIWLKEI